MALDWNRLTPAMRRALRDPRNHRPLRFDSTPGEREATFEVNEKEHVDRQQARDLRKRLTEIPGHVTISGSQHIRAIDAREENRDEDTQ